MNAELVTAMESVVKMLATWEAKAENTTVQHEIVMSKFHAQRAIDWEKSVGKQEGSKP